MERPQLRLFNYQGGLSLSRSARRRWVATYAVVVATAVISVACSPPAQASHTLPHKLTKYPLAGSHNPRWRFLETYDATTRARTIARYDSIVASGRIIAKENIQDLESALLLNPNLVLTLQWGIIETGECGSVGSQFTKFKGHLETLGDFKFKLSGVQIDGAGNLSQCQNGANQVKNALRSYRAHLKTLGMPTVLTVNGAHFPVRVDSCGYNPSSDSFGAYGSSASGRPITGLQGLVNGVLKEAWTDRPAGNWIGSPNIGGLLDEVCAWHAKSLRPTVVYGLGQSCTPWWYVGSRTGCKWKKARLAFAVAQMFNRTVHVHLPAAQDWNNVANESHMFWLDYYAVSLETNMPPSHGPSPTTTTGKEPGDDFLREQIASEGYLGAPVAAGKRVSLSGGGGMVREFKCGFVLANWSTKNWVYRPVTTTGSPVATQMILGRQDRAYDQGTSWTRYTIPPKDARVLIKRDCLAVTARDLSTSGTWTP